MYPTVSIVINTLDRAVELQQTLKSMLWLDYPGEFEVIVVNGPSKDNTEAVVASWLSHIRFGKCEIANLSVSRNIGICMAQGDIVAFIDDDAIPEPEWLTQLVKPYVDPMVGGAGGFVFDYTGYNFQYEYAVVDRFGNADRSQSGPAPAFAFPKSYQFPHLLGCNSSFRRTALLEVHGFDEEFEYFLDETDLCLRIIDHGYTITQLPCAFVHHKFAASAIRGANRIARNRYPILKNTLYFMLKHARKYYSLERVLQEFRVFVKQQEDVINWAIQGKYLSESDATKFKIDAERASEIGLKRGLEGVACGATIGPAKIERYRAPFASFRTIGIKNRKVIVIISRDYPPNHGGGIATFNKNLAEDLAALGHTIHVIAQSNDINRVDFEHGVWVHRMVVNSVELSAEAADRRIPSEVWNWSGSALAETKRIATHRNVDVVEATIWGCEGVAFLLDGSWPLITSLATTLHFCLDYQTERRSDEAWMTAFGAPMLALEKEMMMRADGVRANSKAIIAEIERAYDFSFDMDATVVIPYGIAPLEMSQTRKTGKQIDVLFVGRLEKRKGIDVLLAAIPIIAAANPNVIFTIVGRDIPDSPDNLTYKERFLKDNAGHACISRTTFCGRVSDEALLDAYAACDIFVAPSRFESYGLVFAEAMREGKPVIGCRVGGVPEIVDHGMNGLLVAPDDLYALANAVLQLVENERLRLTLGVAARRTFEEHLTTRHTAERSFAMYEAAKARHKNKKMQISYVYGTWYVNDAISSAIRDEINWLTADRSNDVRLYCRATNRTDFPAYCIKTLSDVALDAYFQNSDLIVFHFGVTYEFFDLLCVVPKDAKVLVVFHNITPKRFLAPEAFETIEKSLQQMSNIAFADHVICDSQFNLDTLRDAGIVTPATVIPLAVHGASEAPARKPSSEDGIIRIAFVGRFVRAKGPTDLLDAITGVLRRNAGLRLCIELVGNTNLSDSVVLDEVGNMAKDIKACFGGQVTIRIVGDAREPEKQRILREADLFVLPTYHEGFCIPILEALSNGCRIITYDNSNTAAISGGLAELVATGDREALSAAIEKVVHEVLSTNWQTIEQDGYAKYAERAWRYSRQFCPEIAQERFLSFIREIQNDRVLVGNVA
jgi:glycosyltransferase involved in cell wall biosynthesis